MAILAQYDPKKVTFTWKDTDVTEGIAPGTFITISRNVPRNSLNVGPDGNGTNVTSNDRSGVVSVTLRAGSAINNFLSDEMREQETATGSPAVGALGIKDFSGDSKTDCPKAVLVGFPDDSYSDTEGTREWAFSCLELNMDPRGSLEL